ncbi:mucin-binding protein, partial [Secundilactobacillus silagei]
MNDDPVHDSRYGGADPTGAQLTQVTGAKVSEFTADNGQTVVKIDYAGTGQTVDVSKTTGYWGGITLANNPDALPGDYPYSVYIVSPKVKLLNTIKPTDPSFVENNPNAYMMNGEAGHGTWNISTASSFFNTSLAQGNKDVNAVADGTSDDKGSSDMTFYDSIVYTSPATDAQDHNATAVINLPTVGDSKGSQYTFNLKGPITVPTNFTTAAGDGTAINPTVLYSTTAQTFNTTDTAPNTTGYVLADQVPADGWSKIRSIIIQVNGIKPNTSTGRIAIDGSVADQTVDGKIVTFHNMAGKTGTLQTAFYGDGSKVVVSSADASIKIVGASTVKARYHYLDANGQDQYIEIPGLTQTVNDNVDTLKDDYPKQAADFTNVEKALIPKGYKLDTGVPTIIDTKNDGAAKLGTVAQYFDDGDFVQYELVGNVTAQVKYVDDDNNGAVVGTPKTISGAPGTSINWDMGTVPTGYRLATGAATTGSYTFHDANNVPFEIQLNHIVDHSTTT